MFYEYYFALNFLIYCYKSGVVDAMTVATLFANIGSQYIGITGASLAEMKSLKQLPLIAAKPIHGLIIGYSWIKKAPAGSALRRERILTLAALLSSSGVLAKTSSVGANGAYGAAIYAHISTMQDALNARGGGRDLILKAAQTFESKRQRIVSFKDYKIVLDSQITRRELLHHFHRYDFTITSRQIIQDMFYQHTLRRCGTFNYYAYIQSCKTLPPIFFISKLPRTSLNLPGIILWSSFGIGSIVVLSLGSLFLFQCWKRRRYLRENVPNDQVIIDVSHIDVI